MAVNPINPSSMFAKAAAASAGMNSPTVGTGKLESFAPSGSTAVGGSDGITGFADAIEEAVRNVNAQQVVAADQVGQCFDLLQLSPKRCAHFTLRSGITFTRSSIRGSHLLARDSRRKLLTQIIDRCLSLA